MAEEEELDFDDPRFLTLLAESQPAEPLTYAEKRKRDIALGKQRGKNKSRKQLEEEAREEGLRKNLIEKESERVGGESKALKMMKGMGFTPGSSLGRKRSLSPLPIPPATTSATEEPSQPRGGIGASKAPKLDPKGKERPKKPMTEPIQFSLRTGRAGLGIPTPPSSYIPPSTSSSTPINPHLDPTITSYLSATRLAQLTRRAHGLLIKARRTMEELDTRSGVAEGENWRMRYPEEGEREERERRRRLEFGTELEEEDEEKEKGGRGELEYEKGVSREVVELDEETEKPEIDGDGDDEKSRWLLLDEPTRLLLTLRYLRETYSYCFWCGCKYEGKEDMEENCPGEDEELH